MNFETITRENLSHGILHIDEAKKFVCVRFTDNSEDAKRLADKIFRTFVESGAYKNYRGIEISPDQLRTPQPPPGDQDIGPHVSVMHYREQPKWEILRELEGTILKIDRLRPQHVKCFSDTRAAKHAFCIGVDSVDIERIRAQVGLIEFPTGEGIQGVWSPHITVAIVPKDISTSSSVPTYLTIIHKREISLPLIAILTLSAFGLVMWWMRNRWLNWR